MMWATVLDFCERALTAALAVVGSERARVAELERAGWVDLSRAQSRARPAAPAEGKPQISSANGGRPRHFPRVFPRGGGEILLILNPIHIADKP